METIDIKDYFKISDDHSEVRGFLEVKDKHGRTVFIKENMVTTSGRKFIRDMCYNAFTKKDTITTSYFNSLSFGSNGSITTTNMENLVNPIENMNFELCNTSKFAGDLAYTLGMTYNDNNIKLELTIIDIVNGASYVLREAGLFLYDEATEKDVMFSRVAFAPLTLKSDNLYTINYYIYF